ncbi:MAG: hypothetical protein ABI760_24170, partial [Ferruginibacter sp.]
MKYYVKLLPGLLIFSILAESCNNVTNKEPVTADNTFISDTSVAIYDTSFKVEAESFADLQVLRYQVPGFEQLNL